MNLRLRFALWHTLGSAIVGLLVAALVLGLWYRPPYAALAGGLELLGILLGVDMVLGPLLTAVVAHPAKPRRSLARDIGAIVLVQLLAFAYGVFTIAQARPVHLVFEVDRFRVVTAADIDPAQLPKAPPGLRQLPWTGPTVIAARRPQGNEELMDSLNLALLGQEISLRPERWVDYASLSAAALQAARPVALLLEHYPEAAALVRDAARAHGVAPDSLRFLPVVSRKAGAVALLGGSQVQVLGFVAVDGFI